MTIRRICVARLATRPPIGSRRPFTAAARLNVVKPFLLADIGEGTRECQIIQWFVQPGARVEAFDKLCEVQSDKTATDITSPFDGVIKKLHYEADDMAIVGKPLVDIDIQSDMTPEDAEQLGASKPSAKDTPAPDMLGAAAEATPVDPRSVTEPAVATKAPQSRHQTHATPAVRHLSKELNIDISDIAGTGRDGRVTKEDVQRFAAGASHHSTSPSTPIAAKDRRVPLTPIQSAMFRTMTRSLTIPHFLYTTTADVTALTALRKRLNATRPPAERLTPLPFILKAISLALAHHPLLNASLDTTTPKPELTFRATHDFGIAMATPTGLLVPVLRDIASLSPAALSSAVRALAARAAAGTLHPADLADPSLTVSNIGSVGGGVVAPVIVAPQLAIVGVGRARTVPAFARDGSVVPRDELVLSWAADHRVVDGAECARAAERVRALLEGVEDWAVMLR